MITHEELLELLHYDKDTGVFTWKKSRRRARQGSIAGTNREDGLVHIKINRKLYQAHRLAWFYVHKKCPMGQIIHINNIKNDNRICNLKDVYFNSNRQKETIKPVYDKRDEKWNAKFTLYGKYVHIGRFNTEQEARNAVIDYRRELENQGII